GRCWADEHWRRRRRRSWRRCRIWRTWRTWWSRRRGWTWRTWWSRRRGWTWRTWWSRRRCWWSSSAANRSQPQRQGLHRNERHRTSWYRNQGDHRKADRGPLRDGNGERLVGDL